MAAVNDFDEVLNRFKLAGNEFMKGNPLPVLNMFSHREDVSLNNPLGPPAHGWDEVARTLERAASNFRDGGIVALEEVAKYVTPELAYTVWLEHQKAKIGGREDIAPFDLRVTMIFRPEDGEWKVVQSARRPHNHAPASRIGDPGVDLP